MQDVEKSLLDSTENHPQQNGSSRRQFLGRLAALDALRDRVGLTGTKKGCDRIDGRLKVTGQALYSGDRRPNQLAYGYLLTSTIANGVIKSMDVDEASKMEGTLAIYTPFNPLKLYSPLGDPRGRSAETRGRPFKIGSFRITVRSLVLSWRNRSSKRGMLPGE